MLQKDADHFQAAVRMMQHGLAVFIFTDLEKSFDMDADIAYRRHAGAWIL
jgi:hypothetical protein